MNNAGKIRSLVKTATWRIIASIGTIGIALLITGNIKIALEIGAFEFIVKLILYYFHERAWSKTSFGIKHER